MDLALRSKEKHHCNVLIATWAPGSGPCHQQAQQPAMARDSHYSPRPAESLDFLQCRTSSCRQSSAPSMMACSWSGLAVYLKNRGWGLSPFKLLTLASWEPLCCTEVQVVSSGQRQGWEGDRDCD